MGEYRFLTPAFLFGPAAALVVVYDATGSSARLARVAPIAALFLVAISGAAAYRGTPDFAEKPAISLADVREHSRALAATLGPDAVVLTPDIGGALWEDRFLVLDPVGLIDRRIGIGE